MSHYLTTQFKGSARWICVLLLGILVFCGFSPALRAEIIGYVPPLPIVGDVAQPLVLDAEALTGTVEVTRRNRTYQALPLAELLQQAQPADERFTVLLEAADLASLVEGQRLEESYIAYSEEYGWEAVHLRHPASANIKRLQRLVVIAETDPYGFGIHTISQTANLGSTSPGALHKDGFVLQYQREGAASLRHDDVEYVSTVFTPQKVVPRGALLGDGQCSESENVLVMGTRGEVREAAGGYFTLAPAALEFRDERGQVQIQEVAGVVIEAPERRTTDAFHDALHLLKADQPVILVILDGLGYHQYVYAIEHGHAPFWASQARAERALTVYQPVTNAGVAAILTGKTPEYNGVYSRRQRLLEVPDIFNGADQLGKRSVYLAGDRQIVAASLEQRFHFDNTGSGSSDDDIVLTALEMIGDQEAPDLMVLHIKDIDRAGHNYGDLDPRTMAKIAEADEYLRQLQQAWSGWMIVTVDHGMHTTTDGGDHGILCFEDMFVPYWVMEGAVHNDVE